MPGWAGWLRRSRYAPRRYTPTAPAAPAVPEHAEGIALGDPDRVPLELHDAADVDRSDGIWRV